MPVNAFGANGAGSNTVLVSPDHDLVVVWRWHAGNIADVGTRYPNMDMAPYMASHASGSAKPSSRA